MMELDSLLPGLNPEVLSERQSKVLGAVVIGLKDKGFPVRNAANTVNDLVRQEYNGDIYEFLDAYAHIGAGDW